MPLKYKFFFLFFLLAFLPIGIISSFIYKKAKNTLEAQIVNQLVSLAQVEEHRVDAIIERYLDQIKHVASQTRLREGIAEYKEEKNSAILSKLETIIREAEVAVPGIDTISIYDREGVFIISTDSSAEDKSALQGLQDSVGNFEIRSIVKDVSNQVKVELVGPLFLRGELLGTMKIMASGDALIAITEDHTGLGETGEVILGGKNRNGDVLYLTPLRFDSGAALSRAISKDQSNKPLAYAVSGEEKILLSEDILNYREVQTVAATRFIDATGWGLVVEIDRAEAFAPLQELSRTFAITIVLVIFFIILAAFFTNRIVMQPIKKFITAAKFFKTGDFSHAVEVRSGDEMEGLALVWNEMAVRLTALYRGLEEKIAGQTLELEKFRQAVEAATDGILITDLDGKILYVNAAWERLTGYVAKEVLGKNPIFLKSEKTQFEVYTRLWQTITAGEVFMTEDVVNRRSDGTEYAAKLKIFPVRANGKNLFYVEVQEDISETKKLEELQRGFISIVSHQLRTPLSSLRWFVEMLTGGSAGVLSKAQKRLAGLIEEAAGNMSGIINMLLKIGRVETGRIAIRPEKHDLATITEDVIRELEHQKSARQITVAVTKENTVPSIPIDYEMIHEVVSNLLSNAIWYSEPKKTVRIDISLKDDTIVYAMKDQGLGIPAESQGRIFELFYRAPNAAKAVPSGSGLGLTLVKALVEKWGGKIWFESSPKLGTTFFFTIPKAGMKAAEGEVTLKT